jgi:ParB family chromosome partitioning protein
METRLLLLHPERKPGVFKGNQHTEKLVDVIVSLTKKIAATFGASERTAHRALQASEKLVQEEVSLLETAPCQITMDFLKDLNKVTEPEIRLGICNALANGTAKTARQALNNMKAPGAAVKDPIEEDLKRLNDAFQRASNKAKIQFVEGRLSGQR